MTDPNTTHFTTENPVRIMFPNLKKPRKTQNGAEKFGVLVLIHKDSPEFEQVRNAVKNAMDRDFNEQLALKGRFNPIKSCKQTDAVREAEGQSPMFSKLENAEDYFYFNANSKEKPGIVDTKLNPILDASCFKSGSYVRVNVNAYTWDNSGKGVSLGLNHIQFVKEGETLATGGGASSPKEAFCGLGGAVANADDQDVDAIFG